MSPRLFLSLSLLMPLAPACAETLLIPLGNQAQPALRESLPRLGEKASAAYWSASACPTMNILRLASRPLPAGTIASFRCISNTAMSSAALPITAHSEPAMTLLYGHRGARGEAPENTLASFQRCLAQGVTRCELDLHLSRDGQLMVIHDPTLRRTTGRRGKVSHYDAAELQHMDARHGGPSWPQPCPIPTLAELFEQCAFEHWQLEVEERFANGFGTPGAGHCRTLPAIRTGRARDLNVQFADGTQGRPGVGP